MKDLYKDLAKLLPQDWGPKSQLAQYADKFRSDFEDAFSTYVLGLSNDSPSIFLLEKQRPLAEYFSRFTLNPSGQDLYSKLLSALCASEKIQRTIFGSLNYDCLLDQAAYRLFRTLPNYHCSRIDSETGVRIAKLHGSCNFVTQKITQVQKAITTSSRVSIDGEIEFLPPEDLERILKKKLNGADTIYPVMCQISHWKDNFYAPGKIQEIRNKWSEALETAAMVVVVGVSYNPNDWHVLEAIKKATPERLLYIGGNNDFDKWAETNGCAEHIEDTFEAGFQRLMDAMGVQ